MELRDWRTFYRATDGRPPRPTLVRALESFAREGAPAGLLAVDLGCGTGRDSLPLLRAGWRVLAVDQEQEALDELARRAEAEGLGGLERERARFEAMRPPVCHLINASFALFACEPRHFPDVWASIRASLRAGGRFAGQLLGPNDSWSGRPGLTVLDHPSLLRLLDGLTIERLEEEETDAVTPQGEAKHWHLWHLNLLKPS